MATFESVGGKAKLSGIILTSPDGTLWEIVVDDSGNISAVEVTE